MGWCWNVEEGWKEEFSCLYLVDEEDACIENVALFSQGSLWFVAVFSRRCLCVWSRKEKLGEVETPCSSVDSLFFVRKGQNLVAINRKAGQVAILRWDKRNILCQNIPMALLFNTKLSLASLSLRMLSTHPSPITAACRDTGHIASYCCSGGVVFQVTRNYLLRFILMLHLVDDRSQ